MYSVHESVSLPVSERGREIHCRNGLNMKDEYKKMKGEKEKKIGAVEGCCVFSA